ncbi:MAG: hypothetical protein JST92_21200 [Deltaproteobacteria bacterium]|nr:hypothetical protein [Deltaproteobacteria bacterium]
MRALGILVVLASATAPPAPVIRESTHVLVDGKPELWRIEFTAPPEPICQDEEAVHTAQCTGFAHGEAGQARLVRLRDQGGKPEVLQVIDLVALVREGVAGKPSQDAAAVRFPSRKQPVLKLEDLDGDGKAHEFVLQIDTIDSSMQPAIAFAFDEKTHKLEAIRTVEHPERALVLMRPALWRTLSHKGGLALNCGDHGGQLEESLELKHDAAGWHAASVFRTCDQARKVTRETL